MTRCNIPEYLSLGMYVLVKETWYACQEIARHNSTYVCQSEEDVEIEVMLAHLAQSLDERPCQTERIFLRLERALCQHQALSVAPPVHVSQWIALAALDKTLLCFLQDIPSAG